MEQTLKNSLNLKREAKPEEIERLLPVAVRTMGPGQCGIAAMLRDFDRYYVTAMGEVVLVSEPCDLDMDTTESINEFCREQKWNYSVLSGHPLGMSGVLVYFHTGFFVSP